MTEFSQSRWSMPEFSREYRDNADIYIVERDRLFGIMKSFFRYFLSGSRVKYILDLGCGDGIITHHLMNVSDALSATLVDPSADMLKKAKERFTGLTNVDYVQASFQDILRGEIIDHDFDFIASSMAIHHLNMDSKRAIFKFIFTHLTSEGYFINIDTVLPPTDDLEQWYFHMWKEWIERKRTVRGIEKDLFGDVTRRYKDAGENKPDTLDDQLSALTAIGFKDVDCFYKNGIFTVFGGKKT